MKTSQTWRREDPLPGSTLTNYIHTIDKAIRASWSKMAPFWPIKNLIAVNPLAGFENLPFEEALKQAHAYFQQKEIPQGLTVVNRESIKWLQAFFDEGQCTIPMPNRHLGFLKSTLSLIKYDKRICKNSKKRQWLETITTHPKTIIAEALFYLGIPIHEQEQFLTLLLTTLPGWASHIQYRSNWNNLEDQETQLKVTQDEYLAFRIVLTCLIWPQANELIEWHKKELAKVDQTSVYDKITRCERLYQSILLNQIQKGQPPKQKTRAQAQLVFCIDVRSEPLRRVLEATGNYETYGFAGFFGVPVITENSVTGEKHTSCPVLLKPSHTIVENPTLPQKSYNSGHTRVQFIQKIYQALKYTFTTPFSLVDALGLGSGLWMGLKSFAPSFAMRLQSLLKRTLASPYELTPSIQTIPFDQQLSYASKALKMIGLTENFAPIIVFCGHGSTTQNNPYATALDCGACGGRHGDPNARILSAILNQKEIRHALISQNIHIPSDTLFIAAKHNTTTDDVQIYTSDLKDNKTKELEKLNYDLQKASSQNTLWRSQKLGIVLPKYNVQKKIKIRSHDWAQVRPEWGLARNASFIIAPRSFTKGLDLDGRSFLHSYEWQKDQDASSLTVILTAPMVVAQWINAQYLFSTLDSVAYGSGSKITNNITGKIGTMQGNASDLMHGLPLQSVYESDEKAYHIPVRLTVLVYAPKDLVNSVIDKQSILQRLLRNEWVHMICFDPQEKSKFKITRELKWAPLL